MLRFKTTDSFHETFLYKSLWDYLINKSGSYLEAFLEKIFFFFCICWECCKAFLIFCKFWFKISSEMESDCLSMSGDPKISEGKVSVDIVSTLEKVRGGGFSFTGVVELDLITSVVLPFLSSPEGSERLVSGINQLCPSCLGDLQSLSEKYLPSNDFLWAIFPNICKYLCKKFDKFGAQKACG